MATYLLHNLHVLSNVGEDGWLDEVTLGTLTLTTSLNLGTSVLSVLDVTHDTVELDLRDLWTLEGVGGEWISDLVLLSTSLELLDELVVDAGLNVDSGTGTAALAVVEEDTEVDP